MKPNGGALDKLMAPLPEKAVDRSRGAQTGRGYDTTGYGYQWVANRLNEVFGIAGWTATEEVLSVTEGTTQKGRAWFEIVCRVRIDFRDPETSNEGTRACFGWHRASYLGDAYKGAFTNALKKTAALIGVGWQAYADSIDDDHQPIPEPEANGERRPTPQQIQDEANGERPVSHKRKVWERLQQLKEDLGAGEFARVAGCKPTEVEAWRPASEGDAHTKLARLETALAERMAKERATA